MEFPMQLQDLSNVVTMAVALDRAQSTHSIQIQEATADEESYQIINLETASITTEENENGPKIAEKCEADNEPVDLSQPSKEGKKIEKVYSCVMCSMTFTTFRQYSLHMKIHQQPKKYSCTLCGEGFNKEDNFKIHVALHGKTPPICPICAKTFKRGASLKSHMKLHLVEEVFVCSYCEMEFDKECELNKHVESHEGEMIGLTESEFSHNCKYCNYMFNDINKYKEHIGLHILARRIVNPERRKFKSNQKTYRFQCNLDGCTKSFPKKCLLERHVRIHTGEKPFMCDICNRRFTQKSTLNNHLNLHEGKKRYKCMLCPAEFIQRGNLVHHLRKTHTAISPSEKMFACSHCTCVFKNISSLNGHITRLHSTCSPGDDPDINRVMEQLKELGRHIKARQSAPNEQQIVNLNTSDRNANACNSQYDDGTTEPSVISFVKIADRSIDGEFRNFLIKQRVTGNNRWYICSHCAKEFYKPSDLIRHLRIHTKERPFKCSKCDTRFTQKSSLKYHMTIHTRNEVECPICKIYYGSPYLLNEHMKIHKLAKNQTYKCSRCFKKFDSLLEASVHIKAHLLSTFNTTVSTELEMPALVPISDLNENETNIAKAINAPFAIERSHKCNVCNASFTRNMHLKRHLSKHDQRRNFSCSICSKKYHSQTLLREHVNNHNRDFTCIQCDKEFPNQSRLRRHEATHLSLLLYACRYCKKRFKKKEYREKHLKRHGIRSSKNAAKNVETIKFIIANEELESSAPSDIKGHEAIILKTDPEIEEHEYEKLAHLIQNMTNNETFVSPHVLRDMHLNDLTALYYNIQDIEVVEDTNDMIPEPQMDDQDAIDDQLQLTCEDKQMDEKVDDIAVSINLIDNEACNRYFPDAHIKSAEGSKITISELKSNERMRKDSNCNESFSILQELLLRPLNCANKGEKKDVRMGNDGQENNIGDLSEIKVLFECSECEKVFNGQAGLNRHNSVMHKDPERRTCSYCLKEFKKKSDLERHVRIHTGEKPFACNKCDARFTIKSTLKTHLRTHDPNEAKTTQCKVCNRFFSCASSLKTHMQTHSDKDRFACEICHKTFKLNHHLTGHMKSHSNVSRPQKLNTINMLKSIAFDSVPKSGPDLKDAPNALATELEVDRPNEDMAADNLFTFMESFDPSTIVTFKIEGSGVFIDDVDVSDTNVIIEGQHEYLSDSVDYLVQDDDSKLGSESSKDKKFQCDICLNFYTNKSVLNRHRKTLHGEHKCSNCCKAFTSMQLLESHYSSHYGHRPHSCNLCNNSFTTEANLKVHLKRMHPIENAAVEL